MTCLLLASTSGLASASELHFTPDRPGVGDSTGTPGSGRLMVEGGLVADPGPGSVQIGSVVGRIGIGDRLEARIRTPSVPLAGVAGFGTVGIGAKVAGSVVEVLSASLVPELFVDPATGSVGASAGANVAVDLGGLGAWGHASVAFDRGPAQILAGGGASAPLGPISAYVHAAYAPEGAAFVGGGAAVGLLDRIQIDLGCDVAVSGVVSLGLGASVGI